MSQYGIEILKPPLSIFSPSSLLVSNFIGYCYTFFFITLIVSDYATVSKYKTSNTIVQIKFIMKKQTIVYTYIKFCITIIVICVVYPRVWPFWIYNTVSFFKKLSPLSPCVCVKILIILKRKNNGLIPHWKMSVSYRDLKHVLCIQELGPFGYITL